jgi:hypothetical protein
MQVSHGECLLHISEHHGVAAPGSAIRITVEDVDALCAELNARQYGYAHLAWKQSPGSCAK